MSSPAARLVPHIVALVDHARHVDLSIEAHPHNSYGHMGAILVDAILQAGMRYETVNARALRFRSDQPGADTTSGLLAFGGPDRLREVLKWPGRKPDRIHRLALHLADHGVNTVDQLAVFLSSPENVIGLRSVNGVGPKTADYLCILAGKSTTAVDVHLRSFAVEAGVPALSYADLHSCYLGAADRLEVDPRELDHAVWRYVSGRAVQ
ncbi:hypothetical protein [Micromonospora saelicesensis]|uniref:Endonuclease III n=1 Tax=Micromonospora saelicesensis TaxID=285676 RepID=A0A1C4Z245_9ACTN|nr:hypothetical protein [Micromonospora saelicesensis]SCF27099.1 hypothetical protein GA0070561_4837 [Micromonospora saelicesensis]